MDISFSICFGICLDMIVVIFYTNPINHFPHISPIKTMKSITKVICFLVILSLSSCVTYKKFGPFNVQGTRLKVKLHSKFEEIYSRSSSSGFVGGNYVGIGSADGIRESQFYGHFLIKNEGDTTAYGGKIVLYVDWGGGETSKEIYYQRLAPKQKQKIHFVMRGPLSNNIVWRFTIE